MGCVHSISVCVKGAAGFDNSMCRCCRVQEIKNTGAPTRNLQATASREDKGRKGEGTFLFLGPAAGHTSWTCVKDTVISERPVGLHRPCLLCCMWQSLGFPCSLIPAEGWAVHQESWLCCHSMSTLPHPPVALDLCSVPFPQQGLHGEGILINLLLSLPFHPSPSFYYIKSTAWKTDTFPAVVSVKQKSASGQVNRSCGLFSSLGCARTSWWLESSLSEITSWWTPLTHHPQWLTAPSITCSGVRGGSESLLPLGANVQVVHLLYKLLLDWDLEI